MNFERATNFNYLFGLPVIANSAIPEKSPKFSLKAGDYVSEECRRDFNHFLAKNFGYEPCVFMNQEAIFIHPNNIKLLQGLMEKA